MLKTFLRAACAGATLFACASAQQNSAILGAGPMIDGVSPNDFAAMMTEVGFTIVGTGVEGDLMWVETQVPSGGVFVTMLRDCTGLTATDTCKLVQPYALFETTGMTLDQFNTFHRDAAAVTTLIFMENGTGLAGMKLFTHGGITKTNFLHNFGMFFVDLESFFGAVSPGVKAEVKYAPGAGAGLPATAIRALQAEGIAITGLSSGAINQIGAGAPRFAEGRILDYLD